MAFLRVLFHCAYQDRRAAVCADASSGFLVVTHIGDRPADTCVIDDFLLAMGFAGSFLVDGASVAEIEAFDAEAAPLKGIKSVRDTRGDGTAVLRFTARNKLLFQTNHDDPLDGEMMHEAYRTALGGWQLARAADGLTVPAALLFARTSATHTVRLWRMLPENMGYGRPLLLEVYEGDARLLARFGNLPRVLAQGNAFVHPDKKIVYKPRPDPGLFGPAVDLAPDSEAPPRTPPDAAAPVFKYALGGITTAVVPTTRGGESGFRIDIYAPDGYRDSVLRDPGRGNQPMPLPRAIREAQELLRLLQGWH